MALPRRRKQNLQEFAARLSNLPTGSISASEGKKDGSAADKEWEDRGRAGPTRAPARDLRRRLDEHGELHQRHAGGRAYPAPLYGRDSGAGKSGVLLYPPARPHAGGRGHRLYEVLWGDRSAPAGQLSPFRAGRGALYVPGGRVRAAEPRHLLVREAWPLCHP